MTVPHPVRVVLSPPAPTVAPTLGSARATVAPPASAPTASGGASPSSTVARGALALLTVQPITWATSLLGAALLPRFLGDAGLGQFALAMTVTAVVGTFVSLGVTSYLVRRVATQPARAATEASAALVLLVGVSSLTALALWLLVPFLNLPVPQNLLRLALLGMVVGTASGVLSSLLQGREHHRRYAWLNACSQAFGAASGLAVLVATRNVEAYMATLLASSVVMLGVTWYFTRLRLRRASFAPQLFWQLVVGGVPFMGWAVALAVYTEIDKLMLAAFSTSTVIGWYAAAYRIVAIPGFMTTAVAMPLLPALSRTKDDVPVFMQTLRRSVIVMLFTTAGACALIIGAASGIPGLLGWPASFSGSVPLLMLLGLKVPLTAVDTALGTALIAIHKERRWLGVAVAAAVCNPCANFVLIPFFERTMQNGGIGAAIVTVGTELLMLAGAVILLPKGTLDAATLWLGGRILIAAAGATWVTAALLPATVFVSVPAGGVFFVVATFALRVFRMVDVWSLWSYVLHALGRRSAARPVEDLTA